MINYYIADDTWEDVIKSEQRVIGLCLTENAQYIYPKGQKQQTRPLTSKLIKDLAEAELRYHLETGENLFDREAIFRFKELLARCKQIKVHIF